jgi:hypothetical protein
MALVLAAFILYVWLPYATEQVEPTRRSAGGMDAHVAPDAQRGLRLQTDRDIQIISQAATGHRSDVTE